MKVALGTMNFGKRTPEAEATRIIHRALDRGVTVFDTANVYNAGESERILGRALGARKGDVTIATKVGLARVGKRAEGLSKSVIAAALDASLERLGRDWVDIYYLHAPDHATPIDESLDAIVEAKSAGKLRELGVSNYAAWQILEMIQRGAPRPAISQVIYNVLIRQIEIEYLPFARRFELHTTIYNPLAGGLLARAYEAAMAIPSDSRFKDNALYQGRYWTPRMFELVASYRALADEAGLSLAEFAYRWVASRPDVDSVLVGPASLEQLDFALGALERPLSPELLKRCDEIHRAFLGTDTSYVR